MSPAPNSAEFQLGPSFYYLSARLVLAALAAVLIILLPTTNLGQANRAAVCWLGGLVFGCGLS